MNQCSCTTDVWAYNINILNYTNIIIQIIKIQNRTNYIYAVKEEWGLMQKTRHLMDETSVSFQMFLILLSLIALGSESQISVFK